MLPNVAKPLNPMVDSQDLPRGANQHISPRSGVNPNKAHFNAGTGKNSSGASFAQRFRLWMNTQQQFSTQREFAAALGVSIESLQQWLTARVFPTDPVCEKLYAATKLDCFSSAQRGDFRREHEKKRGLSPQGIKKREQREYVTADELAACRARPENAFTIRGNDWIICLECGQLLKQIRDRGSAAHLKNEHPGMSASGYRIGPDPANPRYGPNRGLVCNARSAEMTAELKKREKKLSPGTAAFLATVRPSLKGRKQPPEHGRKQRQRRGQRKPEWSKNVPDVDFVWEWLIENKSRDEAAAFLKFTPGGAWARLKAVIGLPVRKLPRSAAPDLASAERAVSLILDSGAETSKLKDELSRLCKESRDDVARRITGGVAARVLLWIPRVRTWLDRNRSRAKSPSGFARTFVAEQLPNVRPKRLSRSKKKRGGQAGKTKDTEARIIIAANLANAGIGRYVAAKKVYPQQNDPDQAYSDMKALYRNHEEAIDDLKKRLAAMTEDERTKLIVDAFKRLAT